MNRYSISHCEPDRQLFGQFYMLIDTLDLSPYIRGIRSEYSYDGLRICEFMESLASGFFIRLEDFSSPDTREILYLVNDVVMALPLVGRYYPPLGISNSSYDEKLSKKIRKRMDKSSRMLAHRSSLRPDEVTKQEVLRDIYLQQLSCVDKVDRRSGPKMHPLRLNMALLAMCYRAKLNPKIRPFVERFLADDGILKQILHDIEGQDSEFYNNREKFIDRDRYYLARAEVFLGNKYGLDWVTVRKIIAMSAVLPTGSASQDSMRYKFEFSHNPLMPYNMVRHESDPLAQAIKHRERAIKKNLEEEGHQDITLLLREIVDKSKRPPSRDPVLLRCVEFYLFNVLVTKAELEGQRPNFHDIATIIYNAVNNVASCLKDSRPAWK